jgi:hypothetical protein
MPTINNHLPAAGEAMDPYYKYLSGKNEKKPLIMIYSPGFKTYICPLHSKNVTLYKMAFSFVYRNSFFLSLSST